MDRSLSATGMPDYFQSLMKAGEQAARQFDDALVSAMGVEAKHAKREDTSPFGVAADLQKMYWS
jgi:polyhydroxyalkanoate synthase subunit PhaC